MAEEQKLPDVPPDRMSIDPTSKYYSEESLKRGIGIRFKGKERHNVQEYCISEGWVRMPAGKSLDRRGRPLTIKMRGPVEAWFEDGPEESPDQEAKSDA